MKQVKAGKCALTVVLLSFLLSNCGELGEQTAENSQLVWVNKENHPYLLRVYNIFTCTEFKKTSGSLFKSGYQTYYIDLLNPENGKLNSDKEPLKYDFPIRFLQESGRYIWFAVKNEKTIGLDVFNANNMNLEFDSKKVTSINNGTTFAIQTAYTEFWNEESDGIVVMNENGSVNKILDKSIKAVVIPDSSAYRILQQNYLSHFLKLNDSISLSWVGNNKKKIEISEKNNGTFELLQPQFIMDKRVSNSSAPSTDIHVGDSKKCYSLSKTKMGEEYQWVLSAIEISDSNSVELAWSLVLDEINNSTQKQRFISAEELGNKMALCFNQVIYCINTDKGTITWKKVNN